VTPPRTGRRGGSDAVEHRGRREAASSWARSGSIRRSSIGLPRTGGARARWRGSSRDGQQHLVDAGRRMDPFPERRARASGLCAAARAAPGSSTGRSRWRPSSPFAAGHPEYGEYAAAVETESAPEVNERAGRTDGRPGTSTIRGDFPRFRRRYKQFDVCSSTRVFDGLKHRGEGGISYSTSRTACSSCPRNAGCARGDRRVGADREHARPSFGTGDAPLFFCTRPDARAGRATAAGGWRSGQVRAHGIREWIEAELTELDAYDPRDGTSSER